MWNPFKKCEPKKTYAFWKYDKFPYFLSGIVKHQRDDGVVDVEGYAGYGFKPFYLVTGKHGEDLHNLGKHLAESYRIHEECSRNSATTVASEMLKEAGFPIENLNLTSRGWNMGNYENLFRDLVKTRVRS